MTRRLLFLGWLACLSRYADAQIQVKESFALGEPIVFKVELAEGARVAWKAGAGSSIIDVGAGVAHGWAGPGRFTIEAVIVSVKDGKLDELKWEEASYVVGAPPPGPTPPPFPPGPEPQPPNPNPPPGSLAALVPDPAHRAMLAEFYGDLAAAVRAGQFTTTSHFREGYRQAIATGKANGTLPQGLAAINKPISDRIVAAITLADTPLDEAKKTALAVCLEGVAAEFKG